MEYTIFFVLGLLGGIILGLVLGRKLGEKSVHNTANNDFQHLQDAKNNLLKENGSLKGKFESTNNALESQKLELQKMTQKYEILLMEKSKADEIIKNLETRFDDQKKEIEELNKRFQLEFENIANKILKRNTEEFVSTNEKKINNILTPLKEKINTFQEKVEKKYIDETKQRTELNEHLKSLKLLNENLTQEAQNLTDALKGSNKTQGNWGEMILVRILEESGLIKDEEYQTQVTDKNQDGATIKPDVVVKLPDNKHIIIDSKVSLTAYDAFVNAENDDDKDKFLKQHLLSVKNHIKELSDKNYYSAKNINSPEFVLMFIPIESSFSIAIRTEQDLFSFAWNKKIVIVSPTTLLATLRTISSVWKHEKQTKNAIEIANQAGQLYDKFVGFIGDLENIEKQLERAKKSYDEARTKLDGRGGLVSRTEKIKKLGAKATKSIPDSIKGITNN